MTSSLPFRAVLLAAVGFGALCASGGIAQAQFKQTDLVSDISGLAAITLRVFRAVNRIAVLSTTGSRAPCRGRCNL
jgi:hypothetical protein